MIGLVLALSLLAGSAEVAESVVCEFDDDRLVEISGMALSRQHDDVLWLHNDSSHGPYVYAVSASTCQTLARIEVAGIEARDLEGMAVGVDGKGRAVLWLGDIGDNRDSWPFVRIHRIREPRVIEDQVVKARTYEVRYPGGPLNAETLLADPMSQQLWIVTKQLARGGLYALPDPPRKRNTVEYLSEQGPLITDGAISPTGDQYVLRDYVNATIFRGRPPGEPVLTIELPLQVQGEAITWTADGKALLITSERDDRLIKVSLPDTSMPQTSNPEMPSTEPVQEPDQVLPVESAQDVVDASPSNGWWLLAVLGAITAGFIGVTEFFRRRRRS